MGGGGEIWRVGYRAGRRIGEDKQRKTERKREAAAILVAYTQT